MPEKIHKELNAEANKLHLKGDRKAAYVYGTLNKIEKNKKKLSKEEFRKKMDEVTD
jgi:hypothetical protein